MLMLCIVIHESVPHIRGDKRTAYAKRWVRCSIKSSYEILKYILWIHSNAPTNFCDRQQTSDDRDRKNTHISVNNAWHCPKSCVPARCLCHFYGFVVIFFVRFGSVHGFDLSGIGVMPFDIVVAEISHVQRTSTKTNRLTKVRVLLTVRYNVRVTYANYAHTLFSRCFFFLAPFSGHYLNG